MVGLHAAQRACGAFAHGRLAVLAQQVRERGDRASIAQHRVLDGRAPLIARRPRAEHTAVEIDECGVVGRSRWLWGRRLFGRRLVARRWRGRRRRRRRRVARGLRMRERAREHDREGDADPSHVLTLSRRLDRTTVGLRRDPALPLVADSCYSARIDQSFHPTPPRLSRNTTASWPSVMSSFSNVR